MLSHQLKQFKIDGEKTIIQNPNDAQKKEHEKFTLETHEVSTVEFIYFYLYINYRRMIILCHVQLGNQVNETVALTW